MFNTTHGIVLSALKYKDHDLLVKCYTKEYGIKSYLLPYVFKSKKGKIKASYFQALSLIEFQAQHFTNRDLHKIKEVKPSYHYSSLQTQIYKSTTALFLSELLSSLLREEEENNELFYFIRSSLIWYDIHLFNANFHLAFLLKLTQFLGCYPSEEILDTSIQQFDVNINLKNSLKTLLGTNFDSLENIKLNAAQRQEILRFLLQYFNVHLGNFKPPKSLAILHDVFK